VVIYPINADGSTITAQYINTLDEQSFEDIEDFFEREAERHNLGLYDPVTIKLAPQVISQPPQMQQGGNILNVVVWSLKMRYWAWNNNNYAGPSPDIQMFVRYFDPRTHKRLAHSMGLKKGMVGVVNAFASNKMAGSNNVVIAHELLHTVGATDKYDLSNNQPLYPAGYASPGQQPLYPQRKAELMAGRTPVTNNKSIIPKSLAGVVIGEVSAIEIRWK